MNTITLRHPGGASAEILQYGAQVLSWKTADGKEQLFVSKRAEFKPGIAIRGGVPIIFPQFAGLGPLPKHGFARTTEWQVGHLSDELSVSFSLIQTESTRSVWPFNFAVHYKAILGADSLCLRLQVKNEDMQPFTFTAALHTYLHVSAIESVEVRGLKGVVYRDSTRQGIEVVEQNDTLRIAGELDRIYIATPSPLQVVDSDRVVHCHADGFRDTVIWNPGSVASAKLSDMEEDGYRQMLCVEAGAVASPVLLDPGEQWIGEQRLQAFPP